jgi:uncharacterized protein YndB with AHSA1/START domain
MGTVELKRTIAAPPEYVFLFFVPQRMPYWYGAEMQSCFEVQNGASDFSLGLKVRISGRLARKEFSHTAVVTAFEKGRVFEWRFQDAYGIRGRERWELERVAGKSGRETRLCFINEFESPGRLGRVVDWFLTRHAITRRNRHYMERLADLAEKMDKNCE